MSVSMNRKPGKGGSCKNEIETKRQVTMSGQPPSPLGHLQLLMTIFIKSSYACEFKALPQDSLWSMARMKKQNRKCMKMNRLAKLKTPKGGLGKNEHPAGLTTRKGSSGKNGALKRIYFPGGSENPKGRSRQKWDAKKKMKNEN
ncbi:hypothetical protein MTR_0792s0030 [Medicago truncatula]|uniref:Uncharacterized protein n=1 Tax=Medicago truncatula TaxID=3880 RepID=A0A072TPR7_MEDTR|nr:hypothetical protein MTR_0792s0030 [Medicago truncatula]